jgi:tetratricopeptide (TPR) repeat protein
MNELHETNWLPGVIAAGGALLAAVIFLIASLRKHLPTAQPSSAEDLSVRYQGIILELKEHAANKHLHAPEAWAAEQSRLEQAAAAVLRERAGVQHDTLKTKARAEKSVATQAEATGFFAKNPAFKGALWGAAVVLFFVVLGVLLSRESKDRAEGEQITGMKAGGSRPAMQAPDNAPEKEDLELKTALERAERSPDDIEALSAAANGLIQRQLFDDAAPLVRRATALDPYHVPTRIHRAILVAVDGEPVIALDELQHIADTFEDAYEARMYAGMLAMQADDKEGALAQFERYLAEAPAAEQPPMLRMGIAQLKQELAKQPPRPAKQP